MADFVELGITAVEKLVDSNFEKIPDGIFHPEKKIRKFRKRGRDKNSNRSRSRSSSRSGDEAKARGRPRQHDSQDDYSGDGADRRYNDGVSDPSRNPTTRSDPYWEAAERRTQDRYAYPAPAPVGLDEDPRYPARHRGPYSHPTEGYDYPNAYADYPPPNEYSDYSTSDADYSPPRRAHTQPVGEQRPRRRSLSANQRSPRRSRPAFKTRSSSLDRPATKSSSHFSGSDRGLGAGGLGALAGGFAAQEWAKRDKRGKKANLMLLTFVGAAIGGLGANALEGMREKGKSREKERGRDRRSGN